MRFGPSNEYLGEEKQFVADMTGKMSPHDAKRAFFLFGPPGGGEISAQEMKAQAAQLTTLALQNPNKITQAAHQIDSFLPDNRVWSAELDRQRAALFTTQAPATIVNPLRTPDGTPASSTPVNTASSPSSLPPQMASSAADTQLHNPTPLSISSSNPFGAMAGGLAGGQMPSFMSGLSGIMGKLGEFFHELMDMFSHGQNLASAGTPDNPIHSAKPPELVSSIINPNALVLTNGQPTPLQPGQAPAIDPTIRPMNAPSFAPPALA